MDSCAICLEVAADSPPCIYIESKEWRNFNAKRIIEKHLWWWHLKQSSSKKCAYICGQCWKMLSSFHDFYLQVKKAHRQLDVEKWPVLKESIVKGKHFRLHDDANFPKSEKSKSKSAKYDKYLESKFQLHCDLCKIALTCFSELKSHYRLEHNVSGYAVCCKKKFYNRGQFVDHLRVHKDPDYFKCSFCGRVLCHRASYERHVKCHKQSVKRVFVCDECEMSFCNKEDYDRHIILHSQDSRITQPINIIQNNGSFISNNIEPEEIHSDPNSGSNNSCENYSRILDNTFIDERNNYTDIEGETVGYNEAPANICQNYFINVLDSTETMERFPFVDSESGVCSGTFEQIFTDNNVDTHFEPYLNTGQNINVNNVTENTETNENSHVVKYESVICSESGEIFNYTFIDENSNCSENGGTHGCQLSINEEQSNVQIEDSSRKSTGEEISIIDEEYLKQTVYTVSCQLCMATFTNFFKLKSHCNLEHNTSGYAMCCNKKIYNGREFADHLRVHENPNYFKCTICNRVLKHRTSYEIHVQSHQTHKSKKKEIHCDICGKKFSDRVSLYRHENETHIQEMQNEQICAYCLKVSPNMLAHRAHIRYNHTEELRHACQFCEKKFRRPFHLREHLSTHTGVPLHACPYCSRPFNSLANLHTHRKKMHPKEWLEERKKRLTAGKFKILSLSKKRK